MSLHSIQVVVTQKGLKPTTTALTKLLTELKNTQTAATKLTKSFETLGLVVKPLEGRLATTSRQMRPLAREFHRNHTNAKKFSGTLAKKVNPQLNNTAVIARRAVGILRSFNIAIAGIVGLNLVDDYKSFSNAVRIVTKDKEKQLAIEQRLIKISMTHYQSLRLVAKTWLRVDQAAAGYGYTLDQTLRATESIFAAGRISGASIAEAQSAAVQLTQGMAASALRGQELASVMEQLPRLAKSIAKELNILTPALEGDPGKLKAKIQASINQREQQKNELITTQVVMRTLMKNYAKYMEELAGHSPTFEQSFLKARTALVEFFGVIDEQLGVSRKFGIIVDQISESLSNLSNIARMAGNALDSLFGKFMPVVGGLAAIAAGLLTVAFAPATAFVGGIITIVGGLTAFAGALTLLDYLPTIVKNLALFAGGLFLALNPLGLLVRLMGAAAAAMGVADAALDWLGKKWADLTEARYPEQVGQSEATVKALGAEASKLQEVINVLKKGPAAMQAWRDAEKLRGSIGKDITQNQIAGIVFLQKQITLLKELGPLITKYGADPGIHKFIPSPEEVDTLSKFESIVKSLGKISGFGDVGIPLPVLSEEHKAKYLALQQVSFQSMEAKMAAERELAAQYSIIPQLEDELALLKLTTKERETQKKLVAEAEKRGVDLAKLPQTAKDTIATLVDRTYRIKEESEMLKTLEGDWEKVNKALEVFNRLKAAGLAQESQRGKLLESLGIKSTIPALERENKLLRMSSIQREISNALLAEEEGIKRKLSEADKQRVISLVLSNRELEIQHKILEGIKGPMREREESIAALNALLEKGDISLGEFNKEMLMFNEAAMRQKDILDSLNEPWEEYATGMQDIGYLLQQEMISQEQFIEKQMELKEKLASSLSPGEFDRNFGVFAKSFQDLQSKIKSTGEMISEVFSAGINKATDAIAEFVKTGTINFRKFFAELFLQISQLLAKQAMIAAFSALLKSLGLDMGMGLGGAAAGAGGGGPAGAGSALSQIFGGGEKGADAGGIMRGFGNFVGGGSGRQRRSGGRGGGGGGAWASGFGNFLGSFGGNFAGNMMSGGGGFAMPGGGFAMPGGSAMDCCCKDSFRDKKFYEEFAPSMYGGMGQQPGMMQNMMGGFGSMGGMGMPGHGMITGPGLLGDLVSKLIGGDKGGLPGAAAGYVRGGLLGAAAGYFSGGEEDAAQGGEGITVKIVNVLGSEENEENMESSANEKVILNVINRNADSVKQMLGR